MRRIILQIPEHERRRILLENYISKAKPEQGNPEMQHLMVVWQQYIEPAFEPNCPLCYDRILKNFQKMEPKMIKLEKEAQMI